MPDRPSYAAWTIDSLVTIRTASGSHPCSLQTEGSDMESLTSGTLAGTGSFRCEECAYVVTLAAEDELPPCPGCGGARFARASLFAGGRFQRGAGEAPSADEREALLARARQEIDRLGEYLAWRDGDALRLVPLEREWTRVGRSLAADVRFDDPTVSRRHALIVRQADGVRVLDDRSLNGVFVNGERVEWRVLTDGDEIVVGRYRLHFLTGTEESVPAPIAELGSPGTP
jgi:FHA domain-containing protein/zinc ribbon family protein